MKKLLLSFVTVATMLFSTNKSFAQEVLDQSQLLGSFVYTGLAGNPPFMLETNYAGQSFKAGRTGQLSKIVILTGSNITPDVPLLVSVYEGNGFSGTPLLLDFTINNSSSFDPETESEIILPAGINVVAGQTYSFKISSSGSGMYSFYGHNIGGFYTNGTAWFNENEEVNADFYFKTFVIPSSGNTTQLSISCGATGLLKSNLIYATAIPGAGKYKFTFSNGQSYTTGNYNPRMYLYQVSALQFGSTYGVTVQAYVNGVLTTPGAVCSVTLAAFPTTQLSTVSAGATNLTPASYIYCNGITGATYYKFTCSNGRSYTTTNNSPSMLLSNLGVTYGTSYTVAVQAYSAGVWNTVGNSLPIFMADFPTTQLSGTSCNMQVTKTSIIYANRVAGGYRYRFNVTDNGTYTRSFTTGNDFPQTSLTNFPGLTDGQAYQVTVQAYVGGVWGIAGMPCYIFVGGLARAANNEEVAVVENNNEMITEEVTQVISEEIVTEEVKTSPVVEETSAINTATKAEFTAYPNPISKSAILNIAFNTEEIGKVILTDITGRIITEQNFNTNLNSVVEIDLADKKLDNGIYNLSIIGNKSTAQKTIVVVE